MCHRLVTVSELSTSTRTRFSWADVKRSRFTTRARTRFSLRPWSSTWPFSPSLSRAYKFAPRVKPNSRTSIPFSRCSAICSRRLSRSADLLTRSSSKRTPSRRSYALVLAFSPSTNSSFTKCSENETNKEKKEDV